MTLTDLTSHSNLIFTLHSKGVPTDGSVDRGVRLEELKFVKEIQWILDSNTIPQNVRMVLNTQRLKFTHYLLRIYPLKGSFRETRENEITARILL